MAADERLGVVLRGFDNRLYGRHLLLEEGEEALAEVGHGGRGEGRWIEWQWLSVCGLSGGWSDHCRIYSAGFCTVHLLYRVLTVPYQQWQ